MADAARRRRLANRTARALRLARHWQAVGDLDEAARDAERALRLAHRHPAAPATLVADAALTLARIAQDRDDAVSCRTHLHHAITALQAAPAGADRDRLLGWALIGLGDQHRRAGQYPAAEEVLARALRLIQSAVPPDPGLHAAVLTSQGITAKEIGDYDRAARCYARVRRIHRDNGADHTDAATLEHNLAGLQYARGRYATAEAHARRALELRRRASRVTRLDLAPDLAVLASALAAQDRHGDARAMLRETLSAYRQARPPRRYEIAVQLHNLADVEHAEGHLAQAEDLYRQVLTLKEQLLGTDHPEVGLVANNLGTLLVDRGREGEAADCYRRALTIAERAYPPDHPTIGRIRRNLDRLASRRGAPTNGSAGGQPRPPS